MAGKPFNDIGAGDQRIDDRWTEAKLYHAGYWLDFERDCRTCGDGIRAYRHQTTDRLMILNEATLTPHHCDGT